MTDLTAEEIQKKVEDMALPLLARAGVDLVELHIGRHKGDVLIQFTADKPVGGITMGECAGLNRAIVEEIDRDGFLGENYALEFSSPGLDRPLMTVKDFQRNLKRKIRLWLNQPVEGKKECSGILEEVTPEHLTVSVKNKRMAVPLASVIKGTLVI